MSPTQSPHPVPRDDPFQHLEAISSERNLAWANEASQITIDKFAKSPRFTEIETGLQKIYTNQSRIPFVTVRGQYLYNFWQDKKNPKGIWRITTLEEYKKPEPTWEVLLDIDALAKVENVDWVWHGAQGLFPDYTRFLISLSIGGKDAHVIREWDLLTREFCPEGFNVPNARTRINWVNKDTVLIGTDFGQNSLTNSGYPMQSRLWKRGTPFTDSPIIHSCAPDNVSTQVSYVCEPGFEFFMACTSLDFHHHEFSYSKNGTNWIKLPIPTSAHVSIMAGYAVIHFSEAADFLTHPIACDALIVMKLDDLLSGQPNFKYLLEPKADPQNTQDIYQGLCRTKHYLYLYVTRHVKTYVIRLKIGEWNPEPFSLVQSEELTLQPIDAYRSNQLFIRPSGFLVPTQLYITTDSESKVELLRSAPSYFNKSLLDVSQHFAVSRDGTEIPFFVVCKKDVKLDGTNPALIYAYGGFCKTLTPHYLSTEFIGFIQFGGIYVHANIRGGGEYGSAWHKSAIKENKMRSYEDCAAVAESLISLGYTSPEHLAIRGGSNGGLLVGNMITHYPHLFKAAVCDVPLLDMHRYHKLLAGHSWIAEYGNPDQNWDFLSKISPYHNLIPNIKYPTTLFTTSTFDDRVHPAHARKMYAKMQSLTPNSCYFYENTANGGHAGSADAQMHAFLGALRYEFLLSQLT